MENAAKALLISGTILITLIVISAFIFMFRDIRGVKSQQADNQKTQAIIDFNKSYESYDKEELLGAELLSLANKIEDYNERYKQEDGYKPIKLTVGNDDNASKTFTGIRDDVEGNKQKGVDGIMDTYKSSNYLEGLYEAYEKLNYTTDTELRKNIQIQIDTIKKKIGKNDITIDEVEEDWEIYNNYRELKSKKFKCKEIKYDKNGRIEKMEFIQM